MRPSFWGHLAMTINNIQTSRNWTRLTQSDQWCQQRQSSRVKRKNMDETHQSCLFTKYQKGQLVKKRKKEKKNQRAHDDCLFHEVPTTNSELWNHQFCSSIYSRSCKCSMRESIKKICSALPKIKHNQTKRNGYFRYRNWMLAYREQDNCHETDERPNSFS